MANMQGVVAKIERTNSCVNGANSSSAWMSWAPQICTYLQENGCSNATFHCSRPSIACPLWTICKKSPSSLQFSPLPCNYIKFWRTIDCERQVVHDCKKSKNVHELNSFALQDASSCFADRQRTWELKWVSGGKMNVRPS